MNGSAGTVSAITAKVGDVEFKASNIEANHIYPGWRSGQKTLEVTLSESDATVNHVCFINTIKSEIKDIRLEVSGDNAVTLPNQKIETGLTEIARGTLSSGKTAITTYELIFPELGTEQNYDMGKSINASISCTLNGTNQVFYSHGKQNFNAIGTDKEGNKLTIRTSIPEPSLTATQRQELSSSSLGLSEEEIKNVKLLNVDVEEDLIVGETSEYTMSLGKFMNGYIHNYPIENSWYRSSIATVRPDWAVGADHWTYRPVLSLSSNVIWQDGDGSYNNPYRVQ